MRCLTPFGSRVHAPWAMAVTGRSCERTGGSGRRNDVERMTALCLALSGEREEPPDVDDSAARALPRRWIWCCGSLGSTALFAAKFRESSARALLLPRRRAAWAALRYGSSASAAYDLLACCDRDILRFRCLLEAYREVHAGCLRHAGFSGDIAGDHEPSACGFTWWIRRHLRPFAASLLFSYVANYIYDGDAPLAERQGAGAVDRSGTAA